MKEYNFTGRIRPSSIRINGEEFYTLYQQLADNENLDCEVIVRIPDKRQDWIDKMYREAMRYERAGYGVLKFCQSTTIFVSCSNAHNIATSAPRHGDKYDQKTGIAVAYAKMSGRPVPDFI